MSNFLHLQHHVYELLKNFPAFQNVPIFEDIGFSGPLIEAALDMANTGYSISVWPPARGTSDGELGGQVGLDTAIIVRFEVNPQFLKKIKKPSFWLRMFIMSIFAAVLQDPPELGGVKFTLARDAYELVNFDEGLVAYHFRFVKFVVLGNTPFSAGDETWTADSEKVSADVI